MKRATMIGALTAVALAASAPAAAVPAAAPGETTVATATESTLTAWESSGPEARDGDVTRTEGPAPAAENHPELPPPARTYSDQVEQWRPLVGSHFAADDIPWAMRVMNCESKGDPRARNPRSSASGLFQHLARYWAERSGKAGWEGADIFDPTANVAVAAWLFYSGGPSHWTCR